MRVWNSQSSQCTGVINLGGEVGCMISDGSRLFVGVPNVVKAWHTQNNTELSINEYIGQIYALVVGNDLLSTSAQDGAVRGMSAIITKLPQLQPPPCKNTATQSFKQANFFQMGILFLTLYLLALKIEERKVDIKDFGSMQQLSSKKHNDGEFLTWGCDPPQKLE